MQFDYFYGNEAEQFTFYRIPKVLVSSPQFKKVSDSAKLLYGLMLDRMSLSVRSVRRTSRRKQRPNSQIYSLNKFNRPYS